MAECLLCEPDPKYLIAKTSFSVAIHFPSAVKKGHIVVGVKSHVRLLESVDTHELLETTRLLQSVAATIKPMIEAERFYVAVIGDRDLHFHYHLLPKSPSDPPLGVHLFGPEGWRKDLGGHNPVEPDSRITEAVQAMLKQQGSPR